MMLLCFAAVASASKLPVVKGSLKFFSSRDQGPWNEKQHERSVDLCSLTPNCDSTAMTGSAGLASDPSSQPNELRTAAAISSGGAFGDRLAVGGLSDHDRQPEDRQAPMIIEAGQDTLVYSAPRREYVSYAS